MDQATPICDDRSNRQATRSHTHAFTNQVLLIWVGSCHARRKTTVLTIEDADQGRQANRGELFEARKRFVQVAQAKHFKPAAVLQMIVLACILTAVSVSHATSIGPAAASTFEGASVADSLSLSQPMVRLKRGLRVSLAHA